MESDLNQIKLCTDSYHGTIIRTEITCKKHPL